MRLTANEVRFNRLQEFKSPRLRSIPPLCVFTGCITTLPQMTSKSAVRIAIAVTALSICGGAITVEKIVSSKIATSVEEQLPSASGISASIPLFELPSDLRSDLIKSVKIKIADYTLKDSGTKTSLAISAKSISKSKPTQIGSLDITVTIPVSKLLEESGFNDAEIVDNALQISVGAGGVGKALLVPEYANGQIYFQIKSVSVMGSPIPASSLPTDIQDQIKSRSAKDFKVPQGLKVKSVSISSKGLSVNFQGNDIQLGNLASSL